MLGAITGLICALSFAVMLRLFISGIYSDASFETRLGYISSKQATLLWCRDFGQFDLVSLHTESLFPTFWSLLGIVSVLVFFGFMAVVLLRVQVSRVCRQRVDGVAGGRSVEKMKI